jgi:putative transposase
VNGVRALTATVPITQACEVFGISRASYYRAIQPTASRPSRYPSPSNKLSASQRQQILDLLVHPDYVDQTPYELYYTLLDKGIYLCSVRTMYRLLNEQGWLKQRRDVLRHPPSHRPQLVAQGPNEVWSWDISNLKGPVKGMFFKLYVVIDIFSRAVVGWTVSGTESGALARDLVEQSCARHGIPRSQLTLHSDRGAAMVSAPLRDLLDKLDVRHSFARPYTPNDNPFSESHFRTLKDHPSFPDCFGSIDDAVRFCRKFFAWYNHHHYHSGIAFLPPVVVHTGQQAVWLARRQHTLDEAYRAHPERFSTPPRPPQLPEEVWINPPLEPNLATAAVRSDASEEAAGGGGGPSPKAGPPEMTMSPNETVERTPTRH